MALATLAASLATSAYGRRPPAEAAAREQRVELDLLRRAAPRPARPCPGRWSESASPPRPRTCRPRASPRSRAAPWARGPGRGTRRWPRRSWPLDAKRGRGVAVASRLQARLQGERLVLGQSSALPAVLGLGSRPTPPSGPRGPCARPRSPWRAPPLPPGTSTTSVTPAPSGRPSCRPTSRWRRRAAAARSPRSACRAGRRRG